ncbi:hypothetical protein DIPPA_50283, partial [Diplonema papillatum]
MTRDRSACVRDYLESLVLHLRHFPGTAAEVTVALCDCSVHESSVRENAKLAKEYGDTMREGQRITVIHAQLHSMCAVAHAFLCDGNIQYVTSMSHLLQHNPFSKDWVEVAQSFGYALVRNVVLTFLRHVVRSSSTKGNAERFDIVGFQDDDMTFDTCSQVTEDGLTSLHVTDSVPFFRMVQNFFYGQNNTLRDKCILSGGFSGTSPYAPELLHATTLEDVAMELKGCEAHKKNAMQLGLLQEQFYLYGSRGNPLARLYDIRRPDNEEVGRAYYCASLDDRQSTGTPCAVVNAQLPRFKSGNTVTRLVPAVPNGRIVDPSSFLIHRIEKRIPSGTAGNMWLPTSVLLDTRMVFPEMKHWRGEDVAFFAYMDAAVCPVMSSILPMRHTRKGFRYNCVGEPFDGMDRNLYGYVFHRTFENAASSCRCGDSKSFADAVNAEVAKLLSLAESRKRVFSVALGQVTQLAEEICTSASRSKLLSDAVL